MTIMRLRARRLPAAEEAETEAGGVEEAAAGRWQPGRRG
jgi:hypothetical protein